MSTRPGKTGCDVRCGGLQKEASVNNFFSNFMNDESGATAIEYGLIAALISVAIIGAVTAVGGKLSSTFTSVSASL